MSKFTRRGAVKTDETSMLLQAKQILDFRRVFPPKTLREAEFKIFSQFGEDGVIQWIISAIEDIIPIFIEFGVEDYRESNTRFLMMNNNWKGLVIDSDNHKIEAVKRNDYYWRHDLTAHCAFVDRDNINDLFEKNGYRGDIGILSIDVDGNDYWIWEAIKTVTPQVVICEYNSLWGYEKSLAVAYDPSFFRTGAHYSNLYYGASIKALTNLAASKGYSLLGSTSAGNNLFFVKNTYASSFKIPSIQEAYVESKCRESRDVNGKLTYISEKERLYVVRDLPLLDVETCKTSLISEIFGC
jgi:hypothetical protein